MSLEGLPELPPEDEKQKEPIEITPPIEPTQSHTNIQLAQGSALPWLITLLTIVVAVAVISYQLGSTQHTQPNTPTTPVVNDDAPKPPDNTDQPVMGESTSPTVDENNGTKPSKPSTAEPEALPVEAEKPTEPSVSEPENEPTTLFKTDPTGVTVLIDGKAMGQTPVALKRPTAANEMQLTLRLAGYEPLEYKLTNTTPKSVTLTLVKVRKRRPRKKNTGSKDGPEFAR